MNSTLQIVVYLDGDGIYYFAEILFKPNFVSTYFFYRKSLLHFDYCLIHQVSDYVMEILKFSQIM